MMTNLQLAEAGAGRVNLAGPRRASGFRGALLATTALVGVVVVPLPALAQVTDPNFVFIPGDDYSSSGQGDDIGVTSSQTINSLTNDDPDRITIGNGATLTVTTTIVNTAASPAGIDIGAGSTLIGADLNSSGRIGNAGALTIGSLATPGDLSVTSATGILVNTGRVVGNVAVASGATLTQTGDGVTGGLLTGGLTVTGAGSTATLAGAVNGNVTNTTGGSVTAGPGGLTINGTVFNSGGATFSAQGATTVTGAFTNNSTLDLAGSGVTVGALQGSATGLVTNSGPGPATLTVSGAIPTATYAGVIQNGAAVTALTKTGAGTQVLSGVNTYTGLTTVDGGTLALSGAGSVAASSGVQINAGAFDISATTAGAQIATLSGVGNVALGARTLTIANGSTGYSGVIGGTGGLTVTGGIQTLSGVNTYTGLTTVDGGTLALSGAGSVAASSGVQINAGAFDISATTAGAQIATLSGVGSVALGARTLTIANGSSTYGGAIGGTGGLRIAGGTQTLSGVNTYTGGTTVAAGTLALTGAGTLGDAAGATTISGGTLDLGTTAQTQNGGVTLQSGVLRNGTLQSTGALTLQSGTVTAVNAAVAAVNKTTAGTVSLTGANTFGGLTTVTAGTLSNAGTLAGTVQNNAVFSNAGTLNGALTSTGTATNSGTVLGAVTNSGLFSNTGTITGNVTNSGTFDASGTITGDVANTGLFTLQGDVAGIGTFTNAGRLVSSGSRTLGAATFSNQAGGVIDLRNGSVTDRLTITGAYSGAAGSGLLADVDLSQTGTGQRGDLLILSGATTGTTAVTLNAVNTGQALLSAPIPIVQGAPGANFTLAGGLPSRGIIRYDFAQLSPGTYGIVSSLDPNATSAASTSIASLVTGINVGFFQPSSAFIGAPADPAPNTWAGGPWVRVSGGDFTITSKGSTIDTVGVAQTAQSKLRTNFGGFQVGGDVGLFNIGGSGYNVHVGVTSGQVTADSKEKGGVSAADFEVPFVGVYAAVTGGPLFADFSIRKDYYRAEVTNPLAGLSADRLRAESTSVNGSVGYRFDVGSFFVEPSAALSWTRTEIEDLGINLGTLRFSDIESVLGRVGARVGTTFLAGEKLALQPFATASVWHEFKEQANSELVGAGIPNSPITVDRVGTFGQVGLGISGQIINTGLLGYVRGDVRFGDKIDGKALNAGVRYQF